MATDSVFVIVLFCLLVFSNAMTVVICRWLLDAERNYSERLEEQIQEMTEEGKRIEEAMKEKNYISMQEWLIVKHPEVTNDQTKIGK